MTEPLFLLGSRRRDLFASTPHDVLVTVDDVREAHARHRRARWVVLDTKAMALFAKAADVHETWHRVLLMESATTARRELLHALFRVVVAPADGVRLLPANELAAAVADPRAEDLFIGGALDAEDKALVLYRGNLERLIVPLDWFKRPRSARPDFEAFSVTDHGQTISLGDYEAASDAILADFDAAARARMREREIAADTSFGGALRRLRLARGLTREDFAPLAAKTIARIERGEVEAPHGETLARIAKRLGVKAGAIATY